MKDSIMPPTCSARFKDAEADIQEAILLNKKGDDGRLSLHKIKSGIRTLAQLEACCFQMRGPFCSAECRVNFKRIKSMVLP